MTLEEMLEQERRYIFIVGAEKVLSTTEQEQVKPILDGLRNEGWSLVKTSYNQTATYYTLL